MTQPKPLPSTEFLRDRFTYNPETGSLIWRTGRNAGKPAGCHHSCGYHVVTISTSQYSVHRIIWKIVTGEDPVQTIDHKNGNPLDNRWINLRRATLAEQNRNRGPTQKNPSGYAGVFWRNGKWETRAQKEGIQYYFGRFTTIEEAIAARMSGVQELFGKFWRH